MLSAQFIRDNPDAVRTAAAQKNVALDGEVRELKTRADELRRRRNEIPDGFKSAPPEEHPALGARAEAIGTEIGAAEAALGQALDALLLHVPNIPWEGAPVGPGETANVVVRQEGTIPISISRRFETGVRKGVARP